MRMIAVCPVLCAMLFSCSVLPAEEKEIPLEAAPLIAMLKAAQVSDVEAFKNAYSKRIREDKNQGDWDKNLKEARGSLRKLYGDYQLENFTFDFTGDKGNGKVAISHKDSKKPEINVVKEGAEWKIDVR